MEVFHLLDVKLCLKKLQMKSEANIKGPLLKKKWNNIHETTYKSKLITSTRGGKAT